MSLRQIVPLAAVGFALLPASALAAPTVTVTGDDGNATPLNSAAPVAIRQLEIHVGVSVPPTDTRFYTAQVIDAAGGGATPPSDCLDRRVSPSAGGSPDYHGNGIYTVLVRYFSSGTCSGTPSSELSFRYTINAGTAVAGLPGRVLTRRANSFVTNTRQLAITTNPGASTYQIQYSRGALAADGSISGPISTTFMNPATGLADFRFDKPGRWVIVARIQKGAFFTPWSAPVYVNAVAPFDLERTSFPDSRGPVYKVRGQIRERVARGKVTVSLAKGRRKGRFHRVGSATISSKGRFTKRFSVRRTGTYRLRYSYKGSSLVAAGRATEVIKIRRRIFFR